MTQPFNPWLDRLQDGEKPTPVASVIDHLASIETPAVRAVRRIARQIREQTP